MTDVKHEVRAFYDEIGWSQVGEDLYHNARYEDLRPVSREYLHRCHGRVRRYVPPRGGLFLDAGSGPVQYPEYITYSEGYRHRVCADISITALRAARDRLGLRGLYVVADIANLPFPGETFDATVSMHTIHHLPLNEHRGAYLELVRTLRRGRSAVVVNGWHQPALMRLAEPFIQLGRYWAGRGQKRRKNWSEADQRDGTFVEKMTPSWLKRELSGAVRFNIFTWRSLSPRFMRWFIRPALGGKAILRLVFWLEDRFPRFLGEFGQYPLIVLKQADP